MMDSAFPETFILQLFIAGASVQSMRAIANLKTFCETHLSGHYTLEVIDLYQQPHLAEGEQIIAVPLLIKKAPGPVCRIIGDMSDTARVLAGLGLQ